MKPSLFSPSSFFIQKIHIKKVINIVKAFQKEVDSNLIETIQKYLRKTQENFKTLTWISVMNEFST